MQEHYDEIKGLGAEVLAISTDNLAGAEQLAPQVGIKFPVLYTSGNDSVPKAYDVFDLHGDGLASASVFIVNTDGKIVYENIGTRYSHQVAGEVIIANLP